MRVLVLGASGMLGHALFRLLLDEEGIDVSGTLRDATKLNYFRESDRPDLLLTGDLACTDVLPTLFVRTRPDVVVNCVGVIKQAESAKRPLAVLPLNSLLPHKLADYCEMMSARLIHVSTDCVFSGTKGSYTESDEPDATDLYGISKRLGEVDHREHCLTLRTSIIGHELGSRLSLLEWFLAQSQQVNGYRRAVFSGLPTIELSRVISDVVLNHPSINGLYHVSSDPIDKFSLLKQIAEVYGKDIQILPDETVRIDRSLDSTRFKAATGYQPEPWDELIRKMFQDKQSQ